MLVLNKDKEYLLEEKFNFLKEKGYGNCFYSLNKGFFIYSYNSDALPGKVCIYSVSKINQDILYDLIKEDVLIKIPNEDKQAKIMKLENQINKLQERINKLKS